MPHLRFVEGAIRKELVETSQVAIQGQQFIFFQRFSRPPVPAVVQVGGKICEERFEPFMEGLERLISMGQMKAGLAQVKGLVSGLYHLTGFPPEAEDFPLRTGAFRVLEVWAKQAPEDLNPAIAEWFQFEAPVEWASNLEYLWRGLRVRFNKPR